MLVLQRTFLIQLLLFLRKTTSHLSLNSSCRKRQHLLLKFVIRKIRFILYCIRQLCPSSMNETWMVTIIRRSLLNTCSWNKSFTRQHLSSTFGLSNRPLHFFLLKHIESKEVNRILRFLGIGMTPSRSLSFAIWTNIVILSIKLLRKLHHDNLTSSISSLMLNSCAIEST